MDTRLTTITPSTSKSGMHPLIIAAILAIIAVCGVAIYAMLHNLNAPPANPANNSLLASAPVVPTAPLVPDVKEIAKEAAKEALKETKPAAKPEAKPAAVKTHHPAPQVVRPPVVAQQPIVAAVAVPPAICRDCGVVESIREIKKTGEGSGMGAVAGGALGGALANQVGQGNGRTAMTVIGLVGGGIAGHEMEKKMREKIEYQMTIRFEDGTTQIFTQEQPFGYVAGDRVKVVNGQVMRH